MIGELWERTLSGGEKLLPVRERHLRAESEVSNQMFLKNLSVSVLRICGQKDLTYEAASERCNLSSRYFSDIVRRRTAPSIVTLEKLCAGLQTTPNELLLLPPTHPQVYLEENRLWVSHICCIACSQECSATICPTRTHALNGTRPLWTIF